MKIVDWLLEPYRIGVSEIKYLSGMKVQTESDKERFRINQLIYLNVMFMAVYSVFFLASIVYTILSFFVAWYGFLIMIMTVPMMALVKAAQKKRYFNRRDAFIKGDPDLIKDK